MLEAAKEKELNDHKLRVWKVWHIAALQRARKLPNLRDMMPAEKISGKEAVGRLKDLITSKRKGK